MAEQVLKPGQLVFYEHEEHSWVVGELTTAADAKGKYTVKDRDFKAGDVSVTVDQLYPIMNESVLTEDSDDLLLLSELHNSTLLHTLRRRYMEDLVYTYIGPIVIAINPFNYNIPWYKDDFMPNYLAEGQIIQKNKPHSWSVAHNTYYEMLNDNQDQCILVSGESGAGKTEAVKIVIKYIRGLMGKLARDDAHRAELAEINARVLKASPILESFGNAKTGRNDNSSRFGKFLQVQFNKGYIAGSFAINYLLEKSRVINAAQGERVYHAFYQVAKGKDAAKYNLNIDLKQLCIFSGGVLDNASMEDAEGDDLSYRMTNESFPVCGVNETEADAVWRTLAGILHLQRIEFKEDGEKAAFDSAGDDFVKQAAQLWQIPADELKTELLTTTNEVRGEVFTISHTVTQATTIRNSLSMTVYKQLFDWLFEAINRGTAATEHERWLGLLDIFGFEDFKVNSFEQLCINLANETLQNHYNDYIFRRDMDECKAEGIDITAVTFVDNTPTCTLLSGKLGVFELLDDECALGKGTDSGFLQKTIEGHAAHPAFEHRTLWKTSFAIKHYAATVKYDVDKFLEKNRDLLKDQFKLLFRNKSDCSLIKTLLPEPVEKKGRPVTVSRTFVSQIDQLMALINSTNPHWIRCIKPHPAKKPRLFHGQSSMNQMVSAGVLETVRIRMLGYPVRIPHDRFLDRFGVLKCGAADDLPGRCASILQGCGFDKSVAQIGSTKVFLKSHTYQDIEIKKRAALESRAITIQQFARIRTAGYACQERAKAKFKDVIEALEKVAAARRAVREGEEAGRTSIAGDEDAAAQALWKDWQAGIEYLNRNYVAIAAVRVNNSEAEKRVGVLNEEDEGFQALLALAPQSFAKARAKEQKRIRAEQMAEEAAARREAAKEAAARAAAEERARREMAAAQRAEFTNSMKSRVADVVAQRFQRVQQRGQRQRHVRDRQLGAEVEGMQRATELEQYIVDKQLYAATKRQKKAMLEAEYREDVHAVHDATRTNAKSLETKRAQLLEERQREHTAVEAVTGVMREFRKMADTVYAESVREQRRREKERKEDEAELVARLEAERRLKMSLEQEAAERATEEEKKAAKKVQQEEKFRREVQEARRERAIQRKAERAARLEHDRIAEEGMRAELELMRMRTLARRAQNPEELVQSLTGGLSPASSRGAASLGRTQASLGATGMSDVAGPAATGAGGFADEDAEAAALRDALAVNLGGADEADGRDAHRGALSTPDRRRPVAPISPHMYSRLLGNEPPGASKVGGVRSTESFSPYRKMTYVPTSPPHSAKSPTPQKSPGPKTPAGAFSLKAAALAAVSGYERPPPFRPVMAASKTPLGRGKQL